MATDPILSAERIAQMTEAGLWPDRLLIDYLDEAAAAHPDRVALRDSNSTTGQSRVLTYSQLQQQVNRIALGLIALGVERDDIVSFQLPNWWQFTALHLACLRIGAVTNPLMPIFRERELGFMLRFAEAKVVIVPKSFRGHDHEQMVLGLAADLPKMEHLLVVGGEGARSFEQRLVEHPWESEMDAAALFATRRPNPNDVVQLLYTSGTTGQPKGVMHTSNTLISNCERFISALGCQPDDTFLMGSPMAHQTGFMYGMMTPLMLQTEVVLMDVWNGDAAWENIRRYGVSFSMASTPFLADLVNSDKIESCCTERFRTFACGGAPIPRVLAKRATEKLGIQVIAVWGMTENGVVTATRPGDPEEKIFQTDGRAFDGLEVRVVDANNQPVAPGEEGTLKARGCSNFVGYLKKPELYGMDDENWFDTGDLARMDEEGYIRISGRSKDIIIRGGENVPVAEVEEVLYRHPSIEDAAVVAVPDERLGERGCAFVTLQPGSSFDMETMVAYFAEQKVARNYTPERLEIIEAMPRTASGKIQKFQLRETAKQLGQV
ncbi:MAG: AMP-binding protein [Gammaproteobacteria bacterium]|nr:AMP-binding protein [Gammaproteobacteria bacterium]